MDSRKFPRVARRGGVAVVALGLLLGGGACELDRQAQPDLTGPAEEGISVQLLAFPDTVNADGVSTARVKLVVRDQNGQPRTGLSVLFSGFGDATLVAPASSTFVGPVQEALVMATDSNGETEVTMIAGTSPGTIVTITVRPYGIDAALLFFRAIDIFLT
jgi:hypothetical protein